MDQRYSSQKNIARLLREPLKDTFSMAYPKEDDSVKAVYSDGPVTINTKKGEWRIYERHGFAIDAFLGHKIPLDDGFFAVYATKKHSHEYYTTVSGTDVELFEANQPILTKNVLEQGIFSWPLRGAVAENKRFIGNTIFYGAGAVGILAFGTALAAINLNPDLRETLRPVALYVGVPYSLAMLTIHAFQNNCAQNLNKKITSAADARRIKELKPGMEKMLYGSKAEKRLENDLALLMHETNHQICYDALLKNGINVSKETCVYLEKEFSRIEWTISGLNALDTRIHAFAKRKKDPEFSVDLALKVIDRAPVCESAWHIESGK